MYQLVLIVIAALMGSAPALAEPIELEEYLASMDKREVKFSGRIRYDKRHDEFIFYKEDHSPFGVTIDAGRKVREQVAQECEGSSSKAIFDFPSLCSVTGAGTIEIRGSNVHISIDKIDRLGQ